MQVLIMGGSNVLPTNPRWRTAAILENRKIAIYTQRLTSFDEIWHADANLASTADWPLKFRIFENPRWRRLPS